MKKMTLVLAAVVGVSLFGTSAIAETSEKIHVVNESNQQVFVTITSTYNEGAVATRVSAIDAYQSKDFLPVEATHHPQLGTLSQTLVSACWLDPAVPSTQECSSPPSFCESMIENQNPKEVTVSGTYLPESTPSLRCR